MTNDTPVSTNDVVGVRNRISWGAIFAGAVLALAGYLLLTLLGGAIGLSINENVSDRSLAIGGVIWAVLVMVACMFVGGFVASQLTAGENKVEGGIYGLMVWAVVLGILIVMLARGAQMGFSGMLAMANSSGAVTQESWQDAARRMGYTQADIDRAGDALGAAPAAQANNPPANREAVEANATRAAWYSFVATLASMLAAVAGGIVGAGPTLRLLTFRVDRAATFDRRDSFVRTS